MVELLSAPSNHSNSVRFPADLLLDLRFAIAPLCQFGASTAPIIWRLRSAFLGALLQHLPAKIRLFKLPFNSVQCMFYLMYQSVFAQKRSKVVLQALCGSCLWIAIADFSGRLMTFVYCLSAPVKLFVRFPLKNHKKHTKISRHSTVKSHAFLKSGFHMPPTFKKTSWIISQLLMKARYHQSDQKDSHCLTQNIWHLFLWKFMGSKLFLCHRFLTLKPLGYHIHRAKERYKFSILGSS